jgi:uncharacterized membrane protein YgdD (TMEM256/DUF423 family)
MYKWYLFLGAVNGFVAVAAGAFAAHGLQGQIDERALQAFQTGAEYQGLHALTLLAVGLLRRSGGPASWLDAAGWCLLAGILLFSGSLFAMSLSGYRGLGMVTPFGGILLLAGWLCLAAAAWKTPSEK